MKLVKQIIYKKNHKYYAILDNLCFLAKNLYNSTLYAVRQHYFNTKSYLSYIQVNKEFTDSNQADYRALPAKVSKLVQKLVDQSFKSFFKLLDKKNKGKYNKPIHIPKYLDKTKGRQVVTYTEQALLKRKQGYVGLSGVDLDAIKFKVDDNSKVRFIRIVPKGYYIVVEIGYDVEEAALKLDNGRYASIDLGINNLAAITSNIFKPIIINGKPLKSINQYYNKMIAALQSKQPKKRTKRMNSITLKRNNKIRDYLHKASRMLVNQLVSNSINNLIIGYNKEWKQDTNLGKANNQKFVQIPFMKFINMLEYKCKLSGINISINEESYTSKCSFLDNESVCKHKTYLGKRIYRGLFRTKTNKLVNADVNGAYNILKKYLKKKEVWNESILSNCIEVFSTPMVITINQ